MSGELILIRDIIYGNNITYRNGNKMALCNPITYSNVTSEVFECLKKKFESARIHFPTGNSGDMEGSGVKVHFEWDGKSNLTITITEKPFIVSCGFVIGKITDFVHECPGN